MIGAVSVKSVIMKCHVGLMNLVETLDVAMTLPHMISCVHISWIYNEINF